jgi:hypothetical protein
MTHLAFTLRSTSRTRAGVHVPGRRGPCHLAAILLVAGAAALAACDFSPGGLDGDDRPDANPAVPDANPIDADTCGWSYEPAHVDPCAGGKPVPELDLVLTSAVPHVYDTTDGTLSSLLIPTGAITTEKGVHTLWVRSLTIEGGATLRVTGDSPLMIVASGEITVDGILDASSVRVAGPEQFERGPGSNPAACSSTAAEAGGRCGLQGGGGGGGGGFGGEGGTGGTGGGDRACGDGTFEAPGGPGGTAVSTPDAIRGGCDGQRGGGGEEDAWYGNGGAGGGAVHLVARERITVAGTIHAGGAGGYGAEDKRSGGGGGGSGGFIGLEAPEMMFAGSAVLAANGGGGGGGTNGQGDASPGQDALATEDPVSGGAGYLNGNGGQGSAEETLNGGTGSNGDRGGGGGGGGAGFIVIYQAEPVFVGSPIVSPPPKGT